MNKNINKMMLMLVFGIFLISSCAQQNPADFVGKGTPVQQETAQPQQQAQQQATDKETAVKDGQANSTQTAGEIKEFKITAKQFAFNPSIIEVNKGDKVRLIITSTDVIHGFAIAEYRIKETIEPNKPVTIEFTADKQGTFAFFCSVICGSGHSSMRGMLVVK